MRVPRSSPSKPNTTERTSQICIASASKLFPLMSGEVTFVREGAAIAARVPAARELGRVRNADACRWAGRSRQGCWLLRVIWSRQSS
jgi:hypothetical protein